MPRRNIIAIGGSHGAVDAVKFLCGSLPSTFPAAIFVVVHVGAGGKNLLADILNARCGINVSTARDGQAVEQGHMYVAPADRHLLVMNDVLRLGRGPRENLSRPAIDPLFRSAASSYGPRVIAVVLTGTLNDGAAGLADVKRCGGITVVQNPADAVAPEMPLGALYGSEVDYRAPLTDIPQLLLKLIGEEAGANTETPEDIKLEIDIALGRKCDSETTAKIADPVPLSCPDCGGVLSQIKVQPPLRYRCQIGHAYTADVLDEEKTFAVDQAMHVALRVLEERAVLTERLAADAYKNGREISAADFKGKASEYRENEQALREAILKNFRTTRSDVTTEQS